jgi:hypothetical protein
MLNILGTEKLGIWRRGYVNAVQAEPSGDRRVAVLI